MLTENTGDRAIHIKNDSQNIPILTSPILIGNLSNNDVWLDTMLKNDASISFNRVK